MTSAPQRTQKDYVRHAVRVPQTEFKCLNCGSAFFYKPSYLTAYRKKFGKDPMYCSMPCSDAGRRKDADKRHVFQCKNCGKEIPKRRRPSGGIYYDQQTCGPQCRNEWVSKLHREKHELPQISRRIKRRYVVLRIPARDGVPTYEILEHRYVMEQSIGRKLLPDETVHHINGDRHDNSLSNLELFSSRHGPGQRVADKVAFAIEILTLYPEFARAAGKVLRDVEHPTA